MHLHCIFAWVWALSRICEAGVNIQQSHRLPGVRIPGQLWPWQPLMESLEGTQKMEKAQRKLQQDYSYDYTASTRKLAIPTPLAFFPLQGSELGSLLGNYTGLASNVSFPADNLTGILALQCNSSSSVTLSNVPYGINGSWAINLWIRSMGELNGIERVFSHSAETLQDTLPSLWGPNQVKLLFPGLAETSSSNQAEMSETLRTVVRDADDYFTGQGSISFLDYPNATVTANQSTYQNVKDGGWHMITLSTSTNETGGRAIKLFIDGQMQGQVPFTGEQQQGETGGAPLEIEHAIHLCSDPAIGRSDEGFTGRLLELALWDEALTPETVAFFYQQHIAEEIAPSASESGAPSPAFNNFIEAQEETPGPSVSSPDADLYGGFAEQLLQNLLSIPEPHAYFPLRDDILDSDPNYGLFNYSGYSYNATFVEDSRVGSVLSCNKDNGSTVILDPVAFGQEGPWALSLWFRPTPSGLVGDQFEYLFSQGNADTSYATGYETNQVRLYFPQLGHPGFGIFRALVRDSYDKASEPNTRTFLDSDGLIGQVVRNQSTPALDEGATLLQDGNWHMITLTTIEEQPGFAMYMDGYLKAEMSPYTVLEAGFASVNGGLPMNLTGNVFLCGRAIENNSRGFDGQLTELLLFDNSLTGEQIEALYWIGRSQFNTEAVAAILPSPMMSPSLAPSTANVASFSPAEEAGPIGAPGMINGQQICSLVAEPGLTLPDCNGAAICSAVSLGEIQSADLPLGGLQGGIGVCKARQQLDSSLP